MSETFTFRKCLSTKFLSDKLKLLLDNDAAYNAVVKAVDDKSDTYQSDDAIFKLLSQIYVKQDSGYFNVHKIKYLDNIPNLNSQSKVLDFGGANGKIANAIAEKYKIPVVDICDVHQSDSKFIIQSNKIKYSQVVNDTLPYDSDTFNVITCFMVLHHIDPKHLVKIVNELHRCCKKYLLIQEHNCPNDMKYILDILHGMYIFVYKDDDYDKLSSFSEYHAWYKSSKEFEQLFKGKFKLIKTFNTNKIQENFVAVYEKI